jgi:hypothetical protein
VSATDLFKHVARFLDQIGSSINASPQILVVIAGAFVAAILALLFNTFLEFIKAENLLKNRS